MFALPLEQWVILPSPASFLLCYLLHIYHLCWVSIALYFEYCTEFIGLDCTLPAQCDVHMCPVLSLHYCHRKVLCMSSLCCTTASAVCYVYFVRFALLPAQGAMYVLFVSHYCQCRLLYMSCLCCTTASTVCRC